MQPFVIQPFIQTQSTRSPGLLSSEQVFVKLQATPLSSLIIR